MKASATLNWRPLLRALYGFLIGIAALWAMPRNAAAQLYVTQSTLPGEELGGVSEYDANTGVVMRASFIRKLNDPAALALLDSTLFVATFNSNTVGTYNAIRGDAMNANFIAGLDAPEAVAVTGPSAFFSSALLFVASSGSGVVGKYDALTGAKIDDRFIKDLDFPAGLALKDNILYVTNDDDPGSVGQYDAITGEKIKDKFITGLTFPVGIAVKLYHQGITGLTDPGAIAVTRGCRGLDWLQSVPGTPTSVSPNDCIAGSSCDYQPPCSAGRSTRPVNRHVGIGTAKA
jgi:hypothetical protein